MDFFKSLKLSPQLPDNHEDIFNHLFKQYGHIEDPWGLDIEKARKTLQFLWPLYKDYFKVRIFGKENVPDKQVMAIANHSGQIAIDALLLTIAFAVETEPPRVLRAMVERFFTSLPWINMISTQSGAVLGHRKNCEELLKRGESVLVFPEGVSGVAKSTHEYYQLQTFTRGFFRMALQNPTPILPIAIIGAEEIFPYVYQAKGLAKFFGLPAFPISPLYLPMPSPVDIYIGKVYDIPDLSPDAPDHIIDEHIKALSLSIKDMMNEGLKKRRDFWGNVS